MKPAGPRAAGAGASRRLARRGGLATPPARATAARALALGTVLLAAAACVPLPLQLYVADPAVGRPVYQDCPLNGQVPAGVRLALAEVEAVVRIDRHEGRPFLELRLELPPGTTAQLRSATLAGRTEGPAGAFEARFPVASLVDTPIVNGLSTQPGLQAWQRPPTAELVGATVAAGRRPSGRHVWFATYLDIGDAAQLLITLPDLAVNGRWLAFPPLRFSRQTALVLATLNC